MSTKFLSTSGGSIDDGSLNVFGATIGATNLKASTALKTNSAGILVSSTLEISDTTGLQTELNTKLTDPVLLTHRAKPSNPVSGKNILYSDTSGNLQYLASNGTETKINTGGGDFLADGSIPMTGALQMGTNKIVGLGDPTLTQDAATKNYVDGADAKKLDLTGGTLSGALAMGTNKITGVGDPTLIQDAATKNYVDTADALKFPLSGGFITGPTAVSYNNPTFSIIDTLASGSASLFMIDAATSNTSTLSNTSAALNLSANGGANRVVVNHSGVSGVSVVADSKTVMTMDGASNRQSVPIQMLGNTVFGSEFASGNLTLQSTTQGTRGSVISVDNFRVQKSNPLFTLDGTTNGTTSILLGNNNGAQTGILSCNTTATKLAGDDDHGYISFNNSNGEMTLIVNDVKATIIDGKTILNFMQVNMQDNPIIGGDNKAGNLTLSTNTTSVPGAVLIDGGLRVLTNEFKGGVTPLYSYYRQTGQGLVQNTTAEGTFIGSGVGTTTIPAGLVQAGSMVQLNNRGVVSALGAASVLTLRFKINGAEKVSANVTFSGAFSLVFYELDLLFICKTAGGSGTMQAIGFFKYGNESFPMGLTSVTSINTNIANTIDLTAQWNVADNNNRISSQMCTIRNG